MIATIWLSGCAAVNSDVGGIGACPPVVEYSKEFQARAAEELARLPDGSAVVEMMGDYAVIRDQARGWRLCRILCLTRFFTPLGSGLRT
ncbi:MULTISPECIES: hypothetical protein [unclassified Aliiroseovarius]|uniref:hypothetical protein n=1 Tax=unclassified Aliiroseovarius TaxID=2623558 RepID=UPI001569D7AD